jgi:hypothetical protein
MGGMTTRRQPRTGTHPGRAAVRPALTPFCAGQGRSSCSTSFGRKRPGTTAGARVRRRARHRGPGSSEWVGRACGRRGRRRRVVHCTLVHRPEACPHIRSQAVSEVSDGDTATRPSRRTRLQPLPPAEDLHTLCEACLSKGCSDGSLAAGPRHHGCRGPATTRSPRPATIAWSGSSAPVGGGSDAQAATTHAAFVTPTPTHVLRPSPTPAVSHRGCGTEERR